MIVGIIRIGELGEKKRRREKKGEVGSRIRNMCKVVSES